MTAFYFILNSILVYVSERACVCAPIIVWKEILSLFVYVFCHLTCVHIYSLPIYNFTCFGFAETWHQINVIRILVWIHVLNFPLHRPMNLWVHICIDVRLGSHHGAPIMSECVCVCVHCALCTSILARVCACLSVCLKKNKFNIKSILSSFSHTDPALPVH